MRLQLKHAELRDYEAAFGDSYAWNDGERGNVPMTLDTDTRMLETPDRENPGEVWLIPFERLRRCKAKPAEKMPAKTIEEDTSAKGAPPKK